MVEDARAVYIFVTVDKHIFFDPAAALK